ncbi:hypothetical protein DERF_012065 [Dermatophagoides farinae]|uniref:Uncharacterized protein n=1 Tax=Dermatophagoides farinae TaxID=6954 RepID=A0A922HPA1_DERFA|nr:hypothetical protein DERF_012065 [Dermatophagoides farinae]
MIDSVPIRQTYDENKNPMEKFSPFDDNNDGGSSSSSSNKDVDDESNGGRIKNLPLKSRIVKKDLSRSEIQKAIQFGQPSLQKISKPIETIGERNRNVIDNSGGDGSNLMTDSMNELSQPVKRSSWMNKAQSSPIVDSDEEDDEDDVGSEVDISDNESVNKLRRFKRPLVDDKKFDMINKLDKGSIGVSGQFGETKLGDGKKPQSKVSNGGGGGGWGDSNEYDDFDESAEPAVKKPKPIENSGGGGSINFSGESDETKPGSQNQLKPKVPRDISSGGGSEESDESDEDDESTGQISKSKVSGDTIQKQPKSKVPGDFQFDESDELAEPALKKLKPIVSDGGRPMDISVESDETKTDGRKQQQFKIPGAGDSYEFDESDEKVETVGKKPKSGGPISISAESGESGEAKPDSRKQPKSKIPGAGDSYEFDESDEEDESVEKKSKPGGPISISAQPVETKPGGQKQSESKVTGGRPTSISAESGESGESVETKPDSRKQPKSKIPGAGDSYEFDESDEDESVGKKPKSGGPISISAESGESVETKPDSRKQPKSKIPGADDSYEFDESDEEDESVGKKPKSGGPISISAQPVETKPGGQKQSESKATGGGRPISISAESGESGESDEINQKQQPKSKVPVAVDDSYEFDESEEGSTGKKPKTGGQKQPESKPIGGGGAAGGGGPISIESYEDDEEEGLSKKLPKSKGSGIAVGGSTDSGEKTPESKRPGSGSDEMKSVVEKQPKSKIPGGGTFSFESDEDEDEEDGGGRPAKKA